MTNRIALRRVALVSFLFLLGQLLAWHFFARSQVLRRAFLHDEKLSDELVRSDDFRPETYGERYQFLIICEELAEQLSPEDVSAAAGRMHKWEEAFFAGKHSRLITYEEWEGEVRAEARALGLGAPWNRVSGICADAHLNTPIFAEVNCDDRTFLGQGQHGHRHLFLHVLGVWVPVWTGGYWVS